MKQWKILVVEDELKIRSGLVRLIEKINANYRIVGEAENGFDGLKLMREAEPDLVITDVRMPHMDGLTMIEQATALGLHPKFIILSGFAEFQYAQKALRLGVAEYLLKPISVSALTELLEKLLFETQEPMMLNNDYSETVNLMVQAIEDQFAMRLGLDSFSEQFKMTPEHLSRVFAKETGQTFSDYLKRVRLEHAKELLCKSNLKIYEIACRVGYPDARYFSKVFKEYTGYSAKQYPQFAMQKS